MKIRVSIQLIFIKYLLKSREILISWLIFRFKRVYIINTMILRKLNYKNATAAKAAGAFKIAHPWFFSKLRQALNFTLAVFAFLLMSSVANPIHAAGKAKIARLSTKSGTTVLLYERYSKKDNDPFRSSKTKGFQKNAKFNKNNNNEGDLSFSSMSLNSGSKKGLDLTELAEHHTALKSVKRYNYSGLIKHARKSPHFQYITEAVRKRKLPGELAFLPLIESNFYANAVSYKGAEGLWQFMPATGRQYGLKGSKDRRDVKASTEAALSYLEYLHQKFDRDWMLTLAAYNAGEGTVQRAIQGNIKAGKPANFWSLKLPKETREYVPKFLAIIKALKMERPQ